VFSIVIVALTLTSTQFGPRMLRNFIRDRGNAEPLAHAEREAAHPLAGHLEQPDQPEHLVHPAARQSLGLGEEPQVVAGAAAAVHRLGLEQRADRTQRPAQLVERLAVDRGRPGVRMVEAEHDPHGRGLARAVRPEKSRYPPRLDREAQIVNGHLGAVALGQIAYLDHAAASSSRACVGRPNCRRPN